MMVNIVKKCKNKCEYEYDDADDADADAARDGWLQMASPPAVPPAVDQSTTWCFELAFQSCQSIVGIHNEAYNSSRLASSN